MSTQLAKSLAPEKAGKFCFQIMAMTDVIGGNPFDVKYATELLTVDPFAEPEDDSLVVWQILSGQPFLGRWHKTGKDQEGRFVASGDEREAFRIGAVTYKKADIGIYVNIIGRVVGDRREFPRSNPAAYAGGAK